MSKVNLSHWSLKHQPFIYFFYILLLLLGIYEYNDLGRAEDPSFVIRTMVVAVAWPGATVRELEEQVVYNLEKKLQETPYLDYLCGYVMPGQAVIYVNIQDTVKGPAVHPEWLEVRNLVNDIWPDMPDGVVGPMINDRFDDVYGSIYAFTADGFNYEELREQVDKIRLMILDVEDVQKVTFLGVQTQKVYVEMETAKLASLGISTATITSAIQRQNAMTPAGMVETRTDDVYLRISGLFDSVEAINEVGIEANGRILRLGDIARVYRGYSEPMDPRFYYNGKPAIGLAVSMVDGGNVLKLGENLTKLVEHVKNELPAGIEIHQVSNQPEVVEKAIDGFVEALLEAVIIVLAVNFFSLGKRPGVVVALAIPFVLCTVFIVMAVGGIDLQKISLGALIISLGLLVDDAIIAVEMMQRKIEEGWNKESAGSYAYTSTAFPMLTGTLITAAGFMPVGLSPGGASEYTGSIFWVVMSALLISWFTAVFITPVLGAWILPAPPGGGTAHDPDEPDEKEEVPDTKFNRMFRAVLVWCLHHRVLVVGGTFLAFFLSLGCYRFVHQEFFPASTRPELIVDMYLPDGSSKEATDEVARKFQDLLAGDSDIINYTTYVATGAPRFVLTFSPNLNQDNYANVIILTKDEAARERVDRRVKAIFARPEFAQVQARTKILANGPPSDYPVMFRLLGYEPDKVREYAEQCREMLLADPRVTMVRFNWYQKSKVMHLEVDEDKCRALGIDRQTLATSLQGQISGIRIAEYREKDQVIDIVWRNAADDRKNLAFIQNLVVPVGSTGKTVTLSQLARISYDAEDVLTWRRDLHPCITINADVQDGVTGDDVAKAFDRKFDEIRKKMPFGYQIHVDGTLENSEKDGKHLFEMLPIAIVVILIILMVQLQCPQRMFLVLMTAPLGFIGVVGALIATGLPMGFVAELGVIALAGMIMRNSVILIVQIETHIGMGEKPWNAIIESTQLRFRPILLTALAAILGMIPLLKDPFWGPMGAAIAGGLMVATVLTLLYLPALYALWFRVK